MSCENKFSSKKSGFSCEGTLFLAPNLHAVQIKGHRADIVEPSCSASAGQCRDH